MPVVVTKEEYQRLKKILDKPPPRSKPPDISSFTTRYLFLRYTIDNKPRVKRIEIRERFPNTEWSWQLGMTSQYRNSKLMKKSKRQSLVIALVDPEHLEPLLKSALDTLGADPSETVEYYWEDDVE